MPRMNTQNRNILIGVSVVAVIAILGYVSWREHGSSVLPTTASSTSFLPATTGSTSSPQATTTTSTQGAKTTNVGVTGTGKFSVSPVATPTSDLTVLIALGYKRKQVGDYKGAAAAWQYASTLYPKNVVSFNNLGDLYMNFLPNYPLAEANYLKQIGNLASDVNAYRALFTLYSQLYKQGTSAAEDILKKGIAASSKAYDLQVLLARYYRDSGRSADAKAQYDAAIANAKAQGLTDIAAQIGQEGAGR